MCKKRKEHLCAYPGCELAFATALGRATHFTASHSEQAVRTHAPPAQCPECGDNWWRPVDTPARRWAAWQAVDRHLVSAHGRLTVAASLVGRLQPGWQHQWVPRVIPAGMEDSSSEEE